MLCTYIEDFFFPVAGILNLRHVFCVFSYKLARAYYYAKQYYIYEI